MCPTDDTHKQLASAHVRRREEESLDVRDGANRVVGAEVKGGVVVEGALGGDVVDGRVVRPTAVGAHAVVALDAHAQRARARGEKVEVGGPAGVDDDHVARLCFQLGPRAVAPVVRPVARALLLAKGDHGRAVRLLERAVGEHRVRVDAAFVAVVALELRGQLDELDGLVDQLGGEVRLAAVPLAPHPLNNTPVGTVTASWYTIQKEKHEASPAPWSVHNPKYTAWSTAGDDVRAATHHKKEASTLRAEVGSTPHTLACKTSNISYLKKDHLQTLTIHYTTSFGLAVRHLLTDEETRAPPVSVKRAATEGGAVKEKEEGAAASSSCTKKAKKDDAAVYIEVE